MDGYDDEDYELLLLGDHIADNPVQIPENAPNLGAAQDIMHENQTTNQASNEADTADDSIVEISYRRVARCRKRTADEAQVHQESTSHRPARQATAYVSAEVHRRLEVTNESNINAEAQQARSDTGEELPEAGLQGVASSEGRNNANAGSTIERFLSLQEQMLEIYRIELINNINGAGRNGVVIHNP